MCKYIKKTACGAIVLGGLSLLLYVIKTLRSVKQYGPIDD